MNTPPLRRAALANELVKEIAAARVAKSDVARAAGISVDQLRKRLTPTPNGHHAPFPAEDVVAICHFLGVEYAAVIERARAAA